MPAHADWPALPLPEWKDTYATLHMYSQVVGKVRLALAPPVNHWWGTTLYVDARGLTTSVMPHANGLFEIRFDFIDHALVVETNSRKGWTLPLKPRAVADFYREVMEGLRFLGLPVKIWRMPVEIPDPIPFPDDRQHAAYDPEQVNRFWRALASVDTVFKEFRARFLGKCSPVHFFWGSFDHCVTRFNGRQAPERPGADAVTKEAYSHEVASAGFWPGGGAVNGAAFYAYAAPEPEGFAAAKVGPSGAFYDTGLKEFLLMYDEVRTAASPAAVLTEFLQTTYETAATLGHWDRAALERA